MSRLARLTTAALVALACLGIPSTAGAHGLVTGFFDDFNLDSGARLDEAKASGAQIVRITAPWPSIAPKRPAAPEDPADPAYRWEKVDAQVAGARTRGFAVMIGIIAAPAWAEGSPRPESAPKYSYRPDPVSVGAFATAVARRYAGPSTYVQVWNEPNLPAYLTPQASAASQYRAMLNAAYPGVHAAGVKLVAAGASPFGGAGRTRPVRFWRKVFTKRVRFDIFAHQPYSVGSPQRKALNRDDVSIADVHKLAPIVRKAVRKRRALPAKRKPFWVTELSWDSSPPDPNGVPARTQARWLADAFYELWRQGVDHVIWTRVRDQPEGSGYARTYQSGVYLVDGTPKVSQRAFAFPLSCKKTKRGTRVWTKAPARGVVTIRSRGRTLKRLRTRRTRIATGEVAQKGSMYATMGKRRSLTCRPH